MEVNNRVENAYRNIVSGIVLKILQIFGPFVVRTVMIYTIGVEYVGLNSLFTSILQVLNLAELGVGSAMIYSMYEPIVKKNQEEICALLLLYKKYYRIIGVVIGIVGLGVLPFLPNLIEGDVPQDINIYSLYLLNLAVTVVSYWLFAYKSSLLQAHQQSDEINKITFLINMVLYVVQIVILVINKNYYLFIISALISQILNNILIALRASKIYPHYQPIGNLGREKKKMINKRIRDLFTDKVGTVVVGSVDTLVISAFLGLTDLAIYQNYYYLINAVFGVLIIVFNSVLAGIGNSLLVETVEKNYLDLKKFTFLSCWIICICTCMFLVLLQPFVKLWVGSKLMLNSATIILLCIYFYVMSISMIWATIKDAAGMWNVDKYRPLVGATVNLILNIVLVRYIKLNGIVLSTILSYIFVSMPWLIYNLFRKIYKKNAIEYIKILFKYILTCIVCCIIVANLCSYINLDGVKALFIYGILAFVTSNIVQLLFFRNTDEFKESRILILKMIGTRRNERRVK